MKDFERAPDMPKFIPEDRHVKRQCYCSPFYPMPPVPSVVGGNGEMNLYESMNVLNDRVNMCISTYNEVMDKCYKTLHDLIKAGEENGAYYSPDCVRTEEGYDADSNAIYKLVRKRVVDNHGEPIRIKMHIAYGNTTNSKIEQNIFDASKVEFADKIFIAQPKNEDGWYGKVIFNSAPLPSAEKTSLYTVGFTRRGTMRVYSNATDINTIINDGVENAMGCSGVLIQNGEICSESWYNTVPDYDTKTARICMGQNTETGEVIWLAVGKEAGEGHEGMTSLKCAEILRAYGCTIAVELCEGENSGGLDKGSMLYKPENNEVQSAYVFWYISRKCFYKNDYERELAELIQNYAANMWQTYLNTDRLKNLYKDLQDEIVAREEADTLLQSNIDAEATARQEADNALNNRIDNEATARIEADKALQNNINSEAQTRQHADEVLQDNIDDETRVRREKDNALDLRIDSEAEARQQADATLSTRLETEVAARTAEDTRISTALENEVTARTNADTTLTNRIEAEETARKNGDTTLNNRINDVVSALQTWVNSIVENQNTINQQINTTLSQHGTDISNINSRIDTISSEVVQHGTQIDHIIDGTTPLPYAPNTDPSFDGTLSADVVDATDVYASNVITTAIRPVDTYNLEIRGGEDTEVIIKELKNPTDNKDAATKEYVDTALLAAVNSAKNIVYRSGTVQIAFMATNYSGTITMVGSNMFILLNRPLPTHDKNVNIVLPATISEYLASKGINTNSPKLITDVKCYSSSDNTQSFLEHVEQYIVNGQITMPIISREIDRILVSFY